MTGMLDVEGFILVGGGSSRMGRDKSQLIVGGRTMTERIAKALAMATDRVRLVGAAADARSMSLPRVSDIHESWGPLGGIHAALSAAAADWCIIVACDFPFVAGALFLRLLQIADSTGVKFDVLVPLQSDDYPQPLCALYQTATCLAAAERSIEQGQHSPRALLDRVSTRYISFSEISDLAGAELFFFNVNTPEKFREANIICSRR